MNRIQEVDFHRRNERIVGLRHHAQDWQQRNYGYPTYNRGTRPTRRRSKKDQQLRETLLVLVAVLGVVICAGLAH